MFQNQVVQPGVVYSSNPVTSHIYPPATDGSSYPQPSYPTTYPAAGGANLPSSISYPTQTIYQQPQPYYQPVTYPQPQPYHQPNTSHGQHNPDIDPPNYYKATAPPSTKMQGKQDPKLNTKYFIESALQIQQQYKIRSFYL